MKTIVFKYNEETKLPQEVIDDAPSQGPFDDYADYICETYNVVVTLEDSKRYLDMVGAWEDEELNDLELNKRRLIWLACMDCQEQKTQYWYMGV